MKASDLDTAIRAVCPHIDGVSIGRVDDKTTWRIDFRAEAIAEERAAAATVVENFDASALDTPELSPLERLAELMIEKGLLTQAQVDEALS